MVQAEKAIKQSESGLIAADTARGLVTIYHQARAGETAEAFHVRFIPYDTHGHFNVAGTVAVGSYEDLDTALTIAAVSYGTGDEGWRPVGVGDLPAPGAFGEHAPAVEGRRISHPVRGESGDIDSEQ